MMIRYPMDPSKVHLMTVKGSKYALDVNSTVFFEIDDLVYDILQKMGQVPKESRIVEDLAQNYPRHEIMASLGELKKLVAQNQLFSGDRFTRSRPSANAPLGMICMNIAHVCNLRCTYCFANREGYTQDHTLMTRETADRAVDFLIRNSRERKDLEISFFGGEPLLNLPVIVHTVGYAKEQARKHGKVIRFHVTTNGTVLTPEIISFLKQNNFSIILSLDGPKEVQDSIRRFPNGKGSYDVVVQNLKKLLAEREAFRHLTIRSTFTHKNIDIENLMMHLASIGCDSISVEPAFISPGNPLDIQREDMNGLLGHYDILANEYLKEMVNGRYFSFFHIKQMMDHVHRKRPKITQCGASVGYVAIGADGKIYPCHKFVGKNEFLIGDVFMGITNKTLQETFESAHVRNKSKCMACWARYICGGACHYLAILYNDDIKEPYNLECEMTKHRIELGLHLYCSLRSENPSMHQFLYGNGVQSRSDCGAGRDYP